MLKMKSIIPLSLTLVLLCLPLQLSANSFLAVRCFSSQTYPTPSTYASNVNLLLSSLSTTLVSPTGFGKVSVGHGVNQVYGLGICRGDVSTRACSSCMNRAVNELRSRCPNRMGSVVWFDHCSLKYSNLNFLGQTDLTNSFFVRNPNTVSNPATFTNQVVEYLTVLASLASVNSRFYVSGQVRIDASTTVYGLVQCTRDLSPDNCRRSLQFAISQLRGCCSGRRGAQYGTGSCYLRYETYSFVSALSTQSMNNSMVSNNNTYVI
ncbi:Cysteine-rich repeat secretory protein [Quillaja saponaria]|uniref:Cysteine-rich repeat secretory protein n=1 Tax=Quillaja saponaria TaxID=32244 RepID=A0AAD7QH15_QUISA|nr:Cysteine-rich repeat secretory protein [Quillaja saponaria]